MRRWRKGRETELERQLRAQRPQPRAEFVKMISRNSATPKSHRSLVPRIALVGAVILLLAASLGAAGALGNATKSVETFGHSVLHVAQSPFNSSTDSKGGKNVGSQSGNQSGDHQGNGNNGNGNNGNGGGNGNGNEGDGDGHGHDPFHHQYDHKLPICHNGELIFVPAKEYFWRLLHGDTPPPCKPPHHEHH